MAFSIEFRQKVLSLREKRNLSIKETADLFQIGTSTLTRWIKRIERKPCANRYRKIDKAQLLLDVEKYPDAYQHERAARFGVSRMAIWQALKKLGISLKKNSAPPKRK